MSNLGEIRELLWRGARWTRHHGLRASLGKATATIGDRRAPSARTYQRWTRAGQRHDGRAEGLLLSVLVPVKDPLPQHLDALYRSLCEQDHGRWEAIFVDDGSVEPVVRRRLQTLAAGDARLRVIELPTGGGISRATNAAAASSRGDVLLLVDHDDLLGRGVLGAVAAAFRNDSHVDLAYTDEDQLTSWGARTEPRFKPGPSPWLLLGFNYVTHLLAIRRALFFELDGLRPEFDGAQDHDLALRAFERARRIVHLPLVGYHWRRTPGSVAASTTAKPWAFAAGRAAIEEACRRRGLPVRGLVAGQTSGVWTLDLEPLPAPPRVQVVLHGPEAGARAWLERLCARPDLLVIAGATIGRWPVPAEVDEGSARADHGVRANGAGAGGGSDGSGAGALDADWLVIDGSLVPDERPLEELLRWTALPGVGAVAAAGASTRRRRHLGYGVRADGLAEPILPGLPVRALGPGLLAGSPREVAASAHGILWVAAPPAWLAAELAGRAIDSAGVLCLSLTPALAGRATLFHPGVRPLQGNGQRWLPMALDLGIEPGWKRLRELLPADLFVDGADRYCPRHELLVELGLPHPVPRARDCSPLAEIGAPAAHRVRTGARQPSSSSRGSHTTV